MKRQHQYQTAKQREIVAALDACSLPAATRLALALVQTAARLPTSDAQRSSLHSGIRHWPGVSATAQLAPHGQITGLPQGRPKIAQSRFVQQLPVGGACLHLPATHSLPLAQSASVAQHPRSSGTQTPVWSTVLHGLPQ